MTQYPHVKPEETPCLTEACEKFKTQGGLKNFIEIMILITNHGINRHEKVPFVVSSEFMIQLKLLEQFKNAKVHVDYWLFMGWKWIENHE